MNVVIEQPTPGRWPLLSIVLDRAGGRFRWVLYAWRPTRHRSRIRCVIVASHFMPVLLPAPKED